jgi:hypothetical protein
LVVRGGRGPTFRGALRVAFKGKREPAV